MKYDCTTEEPKELGEFQLRIGDGPRVLPSGKKKWWRVTLFCSVQPEVAGEMRAGAQGPTSARDTGDWKSRQSFEFSGGHKA